MIWDNWVSECQKEGRKEGREFLKFLKKIFFKKDYIFFKKKFLKKI